MARILPFQPDAGSHTSVLMSESLLGVSVAVTRQNAGTLSNTFGVVAPRAARSPPTPGGRKLPAGTICADVIFVCGSATLARFSHVVAAIAGIVPTATRSPAVTKMREYV